MRIFLLGLFFLASANVLFSQNRTVGTVLLEEDALDGYTFFSPFSGTKAYLVDNCGRLINEWDRGTLPGLSAYFLDNGLMMRTYKPSPIGPFTSASNSGGLELVDWDNNTVWNYTLNTATELSHHDAVMMPNGNILMLTWELIYREELIELGRDPNEIAPQGFAWNEKIIEVEPIGTNEVNVIWEWKIKDHYVQDFDQTKSNFGIISEHPELFDINLPDLNSPNSHSDLDYNHFNAIDYNEEMDQILISVRNSDEIWIIDHSTSIEEAASHEGGQYGKGGDILYRWGNPSAYQRADISEEILFGQHGVNWIREGIHEGKILIFNNGNGKPGQDFSTIEILEPVQNEDGSYPVPDKDPFGPEASDWIYGDEFSDRFYSPFLSNAQMLNNGNILINSGSPGDIFEVTMDKEIVWHYIIPLFGDFPATQGGNVNNNGNFRAYKFDENFSGFEDLELVAGEAIENNPNLFNCDEVNADESINESIPLRVIVQEGNLKISTSFDASKTVLYDMNGRLILMQVSNSKEQEINISLFPQGVYILNVLDEFGKMHVKKFLIFN